MKTTARKSLNAHIRWMVRRDVPAALVIEQQCFGAFAWDEKLLIEYLRNQNVIGKVAEHGQTIVGFMVYELHSDKLHLLNLGVHEDWRYKGVGRLMVENLIAKLSDYRRNRLMLEIRETNLDAQLFFRRLGFRCDSIMRDFYEDCDDAAYLFRYRRESGCSGK